MRFVGLGDKSFWVDEIHSVCVSQSLDQLMLYCRGGHTPPLRYMALWALQQMPNPEFGVRLPAAIFGTLSIALMLHLGTLLRDRRTGILAALLLLLSPWHLNHSQDARYYAVVLFLALAALILAVQITRQPQALWRWVALSAVCALNLYVSYVAVFSVTAVGGYLAWRLWPVWRQSQNRESRKVLARGLVAATVTGVIVLLPWLSEMMGVFGRYIGDASPPAVLASASAQTSITPIQPPVAFKTQYDWAYADDFLAKLSLEQPLIKWGMLAFAILGMAFLTARHRAFSVLAFLWFVAPWALVFVTDIRSFCPPRYLIHFLGLYLVLTAVGIVGAWDQIKGRLVRSVPPHVGGRAVRAVLAGTLSAVALIAFLLFAREDLRYFQSAKQDWKSVVQFIDENSHPCETVLAGGLWTPLGLYYYENELSKPLNLIAPCTSPQRISNELTVSPSAWYVTWGPISNDVAALLAERFEIIREFPGIQGDILVYHTKGKTADLGG